MAEDLYQILGVAKRASDEEIRKAYRKLAKENHPDLNPGNTAAAERFKKISAANDILADPAKRRQYDAGEIDHKGDPRGPWRAHPGSRRGAGAGGGAAGFGGTAGGDGFGFSDIFSDVFGGGRGGPGFSGFRGPGRGSDLRYTLEVDFLEAVKGAKKRVTLPEGGVLDLTVPEGVTDGQVLRLKGKGSPPQQGGEAGDALVEIKVKPNATFKRQGDDILIEMPISIDEAVLGAKIEVPTVDGRVQLTIPKGTSSGKIFRLKGKGLPKKEGGHGDLLATVNIRLGDPDLELDALMQKRREKK